MDGGKAMQPSLRVQMAASVLAQVGKSPKPAGTTEGCDHVDDREKEDIVRVSIQVPALATLPTALCW